MCDASGAGAIAFRMEESEGTLFFRDSEKLAATVG